MKSFIRSFVVVAAIFSGALIARPAHAVEIYITYGDAAKTGFFDETVIGPNGRTLGQARRSTFEAAVSYWKRLLGGNVPIEIKAVFETLGGSAEEGAILAFAGPTTTRENFRGALLKDTQYPIALANQLAGVDLAPPSGSTLIPSNEIDATFNASIDLGAVDGLRWYYGTDGTPPILGTGANNVPITDIDFYSTAIHELGHGLGFISLFAADGNLPDTNANTDTTEAFDGTPTPYDRYLTSGAQSTSPRLFALTPERRTAALISNNLFFAGATARRGTQTQFNAKLYAPEEYEVGSSTSHLDEAAYSGINELMTPIYSEPINQAGPIALGVMADIGWNVSSLASIPLPAARPTLAPPPTIGRIVYSAGGDIWIMNSNGTEKRRVTSGSGNDFDPALSPRGDKVVYVSDRTGDTELYLVDPDGTDGSTRLTTSPGDDIDPAFRSDGSTIIFTSSRGGNRAIYVMNLATRGAYPITNNQSSSFLPSFSYDGTRVAFVSTRDGNPEIYTADARGNGVRRLTKDTGEETFNDTEPTWNRAGDTIAFTSNRDGNNEIYRVRASSGTLVTGTTTTGTIDVPTRLTRNLASDSAPRFSPYAGYLTFQSNLFGGTDIFMISIAGGTVYRLTSEGTADLTPYWGGGNGAPLPAPTPQPTTTPTPPPATVRPPNDDYVNAQNIANASGNVVGNSTNGTKVPGEPNHGGSAGGKSVWYRWVAPRTGTVSFDLAGSSFDTLLGAYTGTAINALTAVAQNDDAAPNTNTSRVTFATVANTTYYIAVDGFGGASGALRLTWQMISGPPNDFFANATAISGANNTIAGTTLSATRQAGETNHAGNVGGSSIWYKWTAPANGNVTFTTAGSAIDTLLEASYGTNFSSLAVIASNDDANASTNTSTVTFQVAAGFVYNIVVDGYSGAMGATRLNWILSGPTPAARPDLAIRNGANPFVGDNVYGTNGANQQSSAFAAPTQTASYTIQVQNDGNVNDRIKLQGPGSSFGLSIAYFDAANTNITAAVTQGTYLTVPLVPGAKTTIRLDVTLGAVSNQGTANPVDVTATSTAAGVAVQRDVVRSVTITDSNAAKGTARNTPTVAVPLSSGTVSAAGEVELHFTAPLDAIAASDATHYAVSVGGRAIAVQSAGYSLDGFTVRLTLPLGAVRVGDTIVVAWQNLRDASGRAVAANTANLRVK